MKEGLKKSWLAMTDQRDGSMLPKICLNCNYLVKCSGGCRVDAKCANGKYQSLDPYAEPDNREQIIIKNDVIKKIETNRKLRITNNLKIREEESGILCANQLNISKPSFLTKDTYSMICDLIGNEFTAMYITEKYSLSIDASRQLCTMLVRDKIIEYAS
jgi:hypothetical protein